MGKGWATLGEWKRHANWTLSGREKVGGLGREPRHLQAWQGEERNSSANKGRVGLNRLLPRGAQSVKNRHDDVRVGRRSLLPSTPKR